MLQNKKVVVVMPAYNAEKTLLKTYEEVMAQGIVDLVVFVDDASSDNTVKIASGLPQTKLYAHKNNRGYGGNQKTCYRLALEEGADIVIMVHPDYQYTPKLIRRHGLINRERSLSLRPRFPHPGRLCLKRRYAALEIYC